MATLKEEEQKLIRETWKPIVDGVDKDGNSLGFAPIKDANKKAATAQLLENAKVEYLKENGIGGSTSNVTGGIDNVDPILINLVRRLAPNLVAYDMVGVQPMSGPTGLIFALRSFTVAQPAGPHGRPGDARNGFQTGASLNSDGRTPAEQDAFDGLATSETFYNEVDTTLSGTGTQTSNLTPPDYSTYSNGTGMSTSAGEKLGMDKYVKVNTAKRRTLSLFRQGCHYFNKLIRMQLDEAKKEQGVLTLRLSSLNDPEWVQMLLMRDLGVLPDGQVKIVFNR